MFIKEIFVPKNQIHERKKTSFEENFKEIIKTVFKRNCKN